MKPRILYPNYAHGKNNCDNEGNHFAVCRQKPIQSQRHNAVIKAIKCALPAGSNPQVEIHGFTASTATKRPLDLIFNMQDGTGKMAGIDLTVINPVCDRHQLNFVQGKGDKALTTAEEEKVKKLKGSVNLSIYNFYPFATASNGGLGKQAKKLLQNIAEVHGYMGKPHRDFIYKDLKDSICFEVQLPTFFTSQSNMS